MQKQVIVASVTLVRDPLMGTKYTVT